MKDDGDDEFNDLFKLFIHPSDINPPLKTITFRRLRLF